MKKIVFLLFILCSTLTVNAQFIVSVLQQHQKLIILAILLLNTSPQRLGQLVSWSVLNTLPPKKVK